jgi:hypothetical protein
MTKVVVPIDDTLATVVPVAAAVAFSGNSKQARGAAASVVEKFTVQLVVVADPITTSPD